MDIRVSLLRHQAWLFGACGAIFAIAMFAPLRAEDWNTPNWVVLSDFALVLVTALIAYTHRIRPPAWSVLLAGAVLATVPLASLPQGAFMAAVRVFCLSYVCLTAYRLADTRAWVWPVAWLFLNQALLVMPRILDGRQAGMARTITVLGTASMLPYLVALFARPRWLSYVMGLSSGILMAASGSRAPLIGVSAYATFRKGWPMVLATVCTAVFVGVVLLRGELYRVANLATIESDVTGRSVTVHFIPQETPTAVPTPAPTSTPLPIQTAAPTATARTQEPQASPAGNQAPPAVVVPTQTPTPVPTIAPKSQAMVELEQASADLCSHVTGTDVPCAKGGFTWTGYGLHGYVQAAGWPRPHNTFALLAFEMGILCLVPASLLFFWIEASWRRHRWAGLAPLAMILAYGIVEDSWLQPEGMYVMAFALLSPFLAQVGSDQKGAPL